MKNTFTMKRLALAILMGSLFVGINAQVTINVPADFPTLDAAMKSISTNAEVANDAEVIINITESIAETTEQNMWNFGFSGLKITVQGQGVNTVVSSALGEKPSITEANGNRYAQIGNNASVHTGLDLIFKNLTLKNFGTAFSGNATGSLFYFFVHPTSQWNAKITFMNVVVEGCVGRGIIRGLAASPEVGELEFVFDNCYFTDNTSTVQDPPTGSPLKGLFLSDAGGKFTIKNCTFFNNSAYDIETKSRTNGFLINLDVNFGINAEVLIEGNQFINNHYTDDSPADVIQPLISIKPIRSGTNTETVNLTFKDNQMIGNSRTGNLNDIGLLITKPEFVTISSESTGNLINSAKKEVGTEYQDIELPESTVNAELTFTSPEVNYEMEGDLPKLTADEFGILHATMIPAGLDNEMGFNSQIFPNPSNGNFDLNLSNIGLVNYTIFNLVGKMVQSGIVVNGHKKIDLTSEQSGIYIMKLQSADGISSTVKLIVK